jgi:sugar (pentulose or hexulose) kinase
VNRRIIRLTSDSSFTLANFMCTQVYAIPATPRVGIDVLRESEAAKLGRIFAHGGLFITEGIAESLLAAAIKTPVAANGGAWGIAHLAAYLNHRKPGQTLDDFLQTSRFADTQLTTAEPDPADVAGLETFLQRFVAAIPVEQAAVQHS